MYPSGVGYQNATLVNVGASLRHALGHEAASGHGVGFATKTLVN